MYEAHVAVYRKSGCTMVISSELCMVHVVVVGSFATPCCESVICSAASEPLESSFSIEVER